jgi:glycosyltransferase involved in cell wall biosynthesis
MVSEHASPLAILGGVDAGGQNVHVAALAEAMARQGAEVVVYTRRDDPKLPRRVRFVRNVTVEHVDAGPPEVIEKDKLLPYMPAFAGVLAERWKRWRPDVVHAHFWMSGLAATSAAHRHEIPVVQTFHALGVEKRRHQGTKDTSPPSRLDDERRIAQTVTRIVATATAEAFELVRMGSDAAKISIVPCGVDLSVFHPLGECEPRNPRFRRRIVSLGRLVERKGVGDAIEALVDLPDTELVIAGGPERARLKDDPEATRLRAIAQRLRVEDRVDFRGRVCRRDVPALLRSADAVVCYPWYEPFGIVPLEAMACAVPVVVARVGGLVDSVVDGVTGVHVPPRTPYALARALRGLLDDERLRFSLGLAGARRANERYGWARIASDTLAVYSDIRVERYFAYRAS